MPSNVEKDKMYFLTPKKGNLQACSKCAGELIYFYTIYASYIWRCAECSRSIEIPFDDVHEDFEFSYDKVIKIWNNRMRLAYIDEL